MTKTCNHCGIIQYYQLHPKRRSDGRKRFIDSKGKLWKGCTCPSCSSSPKAIYVSNKRTCTLCNSILPITRYFKCETCVPKLNEDTDINLIYY